MEIPYEVTARRDTGLYNAKVGIWLFLASEVMLFGGLFSAYVFLRVGVNEGIDTPWPMGLDVHGNYVWLGFLNTIILILSSVFVVFAWLALKERSWNSFRNWMIGVIACAAVFMVNKTIEYNNKLNHHFGVKLKDNSVIEGEVLEGTDKITFEGTKISFGLLSDLPAFAAHVSGPFPELTYEGKHAWTDEPQKAVIRSKSDLKHWYYGKRREVSSALAKARKEFRASKRSGENKPLKSIGSKAELVAASPFILHAKDRKVTSYDEKTLNYIDSTIVEGTLKNDLVKLEPHQIDLQMVPLVKQDNAEVWKHFEDYPEHIKEAWQKAQAERLTEIREHWGKRHPGEPVPGKIVQSAFINLHSFKNLDLHAEESGEGDHPEKAAEHKSADDPHKDHADEQHGEGHGGHGGHASIEIPRSEIKFMGNHGPRYGNYYAIYFTMTALHGLHVIGGALVLAFFVLFGKKLYLKNPEHLANRVEVGGLFWHFVDLVWIFLFPIMYLL